MFHLSPKLFPITFGGNSGRSNVETAPSPIHLAAAWSFWPGVKLAYFPPRTRLVQPSKPGVWTHFLIGLSNPEHSQKLSQNEIFDVTSRPTFSSSSPARGSISTASPLKSTITAPILQSGISIKEASWARETSPKLSPPVQVLGVYLVFGIAVIFTCEERRVSQLAIQNHPLESRPRPDATEVQIRMTSL